MITWTGFRRPAIPFPPGPLRAELLNVERLEDEARGRAASLRVGLRAGDVTAHQARIRQNAKVLRVAYRAFAEDAKQGAVPPAAEWLLDNYHLVEAEILNVRRDLPRSYYRELPKATSGETGAASREPT